MSTDTGINVTPELYRERALELANLYEQISQASGSKSAGQRAIANRLVEKYSDEVTQIFNQLQEVLNQVEPDVLAGLYTGIAKRLEKTYDEKVDAYLKSEAEANKSDAPTEEIDVVKLTEEYKEGVKQLGLLKSVLEMFGRGDEISDVDPPKRMTGARGPRGPRALSQVQFIVNGKDLSAADNTVTSVARMLGFEDKTETKTAKDGTTEEVKVTAGKQFREFLTTKGVDLKEIPEEFGGFKGPNGAVVKGRKIAATEDDDEDENEGSDSES